MKNIDTDIQKIDEIMTRGVEEIFIKEDLKKKLLSGKKLRIKLGIDPTSPFIHLGRAVVLRKLKAFQDLGHHIILIIGDYTAKIGDPSDKLEKRPMLSDKEIKNNLKKYLDQISLVLNMKKVEVRYNSEWLKKINFFQIGELLECFTVQQMTKRRNFKERLDKGQDIFMIEFLYPALQGYDSVIVKADVELGGFDQLFNLMAGRTVQKKYGQEEQNVMTIQMLDGTDGRKMSSSWGNIISVIDTPNEMFGKVMSLKDELIIKYFLLATDTETDQIKEYEKSIKKGENPIIYKKILAEEITTLYHDREKAQKAKDFWENTFSKKEIPDDVQEFKMGKDLFVDILLKAEIISSKGEFRRLADSGAISNMETGEKIEDIQTRVEKGTYRIGKKRFIKIV